MIFKDVRSTPAISEGKRSRNSSEISQPRSRHTSTSSSGMGSVRTMESALRTVEMATAETKIFSVAVSQGKAENSSNMMRNVVMKVGCLMKNKNKSGDHLKIFKGCGAPACKPTCDLASILATRDSRWRRSSS